MNERHAIEPTRRQRRVLEAENKRWPDRLIKVPPENWPMNSQNKKLPDEVWRSKYFLVQVFHDFDGIERLSIIRTTHTGIDWEQNITWEELQSLKSQCGRGDKDAVEVFPADGDVVNVANMRHIWVMPDKLKFVWR